MWPCKYYCTSRPIWTLVCKISIFPSQHLKLLWNIFIFHCVTVLYSVYCNGTTPQWCNCIYYGRCNMEMREAHVHAAFHGIISGLVWGIKRQTCFYKGHFIETLNLMNHFFFTCKFIRVSKQLLPIRGITVLLCKFLHAGNVSFTLHPCVLQWILVLYRCKQSRKLL